MSVNRISQSHAHEKEAVQNANSQKSPAAETKANAVAGPNNSRVHSQQQTQQPAAQTQQPAKTDNNAGREQEQHENTGNDTNGTRVNVFA
jgi:hypothetical protein